MSHALHRLSIWIGISIACLILYSPSALADVKDSAIRCSPAAGKVHKDPGHSTFELGVVTHFPVGQPPSLIARLHEIGADHVRDTLPWNSASLALSTSAGYEARLARAGIGLVFLPVLASPAVENGNTVMSREALIRWRGYVSDALAALPDARAVEVGNEFNGTQFVRGPLRQMAPDQRIPAYMALIATAREAVVRSGRDDVQVWGGATHSIPVDYIAALLRAGLASCADALAIHPYSSEPEQFADQIAVLRQVTGSDMPIVVTEFGRIDSTPWDQADYLVRMVAAMAGAQVRSASWYLAIAERWSPHMELMDAAGNLTPAGHAFTLLTHEVIGSGPARVLALGPFVRATAFGQHAAIIWGEPGAATIDARATVRDVSGAILHPPYKLDSRHPLIVFAGNKQAVDQLIRRAHTPLFADSFWQFAMASPDRTGWSDPWQYEFATAANDWKPLSTMGGGHRAGEPWYPYLGDPYQRPFAVTARSVDAIPGGGERETVMLPGARSYRITVTMAPKGKGQAAVRLVVSAMDRVLFSAVASDGRPVETSFVFRAKRAQAVTFTLSRGDAMRTVSVNRRYTIRACGVEPGRDCIN